MSKKLNENEKTALCNFIALCIGERTLDQVSADTEAAIAEQRKNGILSEKLAGISKISRNMLSRLKNGDFSRFPPMEYFELLTCESSKPQNGVTLQDFKNIQDLIGDFNNSKTIQPTIGQRDSVENVNKPFKPMVAEITVKLTIEEKEQTFIIKDIYNSGEYAFKSDGCDLQITIKAERPE